MKKLGIVIIGLALTSCVNKPVTLDTPKVKVDVPEAKVNEDLTPTLKTGSFDLVITTQNEQVQFTQKDELTVLCEAKEKGFNVTAFPSRKDEPKISAIVSLQIPKQMWPGSDFEVDKVDFKVNYTSNQDSPVQVVIGKKDSNEQQIFRLAEGSSSDCSIQISKEGKTVKGKFICERVDEIQSASSQADITGSFDCQLD